MEQLSPSEHKAYADNFWRDQPEPLIGMFIIANIQSPRAIRKSVTSISKLGYKKLRVYIIDNSDNNRHQGLAKKLSVSYISVSIDTNEIYEKIASIKKIMATFVITPGITVKKDMLRNLVPYMKPDVDAVAATLVVKGNGAANSLLGIRQARLAENPVSQSVVKLALEVGSVDGKVFLATDRAIVERGLIMKKTIWSKLFANPARFVAVSATVVLLLLLIPISFGLNQSKMSSMKSVEVDATMPSTPPAQSSAATDTPQTTTKLENPDKGTIKTVTLAIKPGDSMSSLITGYINDMHSSFPDLTLARLGYAQDSLMVHYGYKKLPSNEKTFTIAAADVKQAWSTVDQADSWEAFWADYAVRAGIKW